MNTTPQQHGDFQKQEMAFKAWLRSRGAEVLAPTNVYEILRFTTPEGTGVIYRNGRGRITSWQNGAREAFAAFQTNAAWRVGERAARKTKFAKTFDALVARDGDTCLFCGHAVTLENGSIEHIVPLTSGGPDHMANLSLAHESCNYAAGNLSAREKFEMAFRRRAKINGVKS